MNSQIGGTILHVFWNYLFVSQMGLGVVGTGIAGVLTNGFLLAANIYQT